VGTKPFRRVSYTPAARQAVTLDRRSRAGDARQDSGAGLSSAALMVLFVDLPMLARPGPLLPDDSIAR
jgi:hypothetical protein